MAGCSSCAVGSCASGEALIRLGVDVANFDAVIALAGNPNTGKSTVFNALTGLRQHTGNWPGKTVVRMEGSFEYGDRRYKLVDLPGTYSLLSITVDEEIARDFVLFGRPDATVVVVDATCLERNLNLLLQILEITDRVVVCLNIMDEAKSKGIRIDAKQLERDLGVPVVPTSARFGEGLDDLVEAISRVSMGQVSANPHRVRMPSSLQNAVDDLVPAIREEFPGLPNSRWVAMRLLDGDPRIQAAVTNGELAALAEGTDSTPSGKKRVPSLAEEAVV